MTNLADELERLAKDVAPLPWSDTERDQNAQVVIKDRDNLELATLWHHCVGALEIQSHANAALIVALRNALPAILSALRGEEWQGIETAPKDGTVIDVWRPDGGRETVFWGFPHHDCGEMGGLCDSDWHSLRKAGWVCTSFSEFVGTVNRFTHWRHLPPPPKGTE